MKNIKYLLVMIIVLTSTFSCVEDENVYVEPSPWDAVTTKALNYTQGPLKTVNFPNNPIPGEDVNVVLTYSSAESILEARIYFSMGDNPVYVKANKISGEDDASFTQTGVTINMKDQSQSGVKTSFYVRIATANAEYYYGNDGTMYLDDTPGGGATDESDTFKENPSLWNVFTAQ